MSEVLHVPTAAEFAARGESPDVLFWVGCAGSFDDRARKITKAFVRILNAAKVKYAVLGTEESCSGDPARRAGNEFLFQMQALNNITVLNGYAVKRIVTACPHCFNTLKNEYPALGGHYEVMHHTQFINALMKEGRIKVRNDFVTADKSVRDEGVQRAKEWIEVAAKLGAPTIRLFADSQAPFKNWHIASGNASREVVESWMADSFRECAEHAKKFGIIIAVQNHADFICTGQQHLSLLQRVDHESCMALVDTGKYVTKDPYADIALMVPYAVNWQIKETLDGNADSPRTDFKKLVTIICDGGYRGFLPIETLSMGRKNYDPFSEVAKVLMELRTSIATN